MASGIGLTVLVIVLTVCHRLKNSVTDAKEYCHNEQFVAKCPDNNELILITSAMYGRMRVGKCVKEAFGYLDCYADVTRHIHERCSGRPSCAIRVPDATLDGTKPCNEDLKSYLEVNYTCIKVAGLASVGDSCDLAADSEVFTGFLSNRFPSSSSKQCGSPESPWMIRVFPGQRINLTLLDFSSGPVFFKDPSPATPCDLYAVVQETEGVSGTNVCGTGRVQSLHVYTSVGNSLKVILKPRKVNSTNNFVFRYDAIGCPDFEKPQNAWVKRIGEDGGGGGGGGSAAADEVTVGCDGSDDVWQVVCDGNRWEGTPGNCSAVSSKGARREEGLSSLSVGASILTILGVSMTIGVIVLVVGLFYMRSKRIGNVIGQELAMRDLKPLSSATAVYDTTVVYARNKAFEPVKVNIVRSPMTSAAAKPGQEKCAIEPPSEYEYVWDSPSNMASGHVASCSVASKAVDNGPDLLKVTSCTASTSSSSNPLTPMGAPGQRSVTLPKKEMGRRFERQAGILGRGGASTVRKPEMGPAASSSSSSSSSSCSPHPLGPRPAFDRTDNLRSCSVRGSGTREGGGQFVGSQKTGPTRGSADLLGAKRAALLPEEEVPPPLAVRQYRR